MHISLSFSYLALLRKIHFKEVYINTGRESLVLEPNVSLCRSVLVFLIWFWGHKHLSCLYPVTVIQMAFWARLIYLAHSSFWTILSLRPSERFGAFSCSHSGIQMFPPHCLHHRQKKINASLETSIYSTVQIFCRSLATLTHSGHVNPQASCSHIPAAPGSSACTCKGDAPRLVRCQRHNCNCLGRCTLKQTFIFLHFSLRWGSASYPSH